MDLQGNGELRVGLAMLILVASASAELKRGLGIRISVDFKFSRRFALMHREGVRPVIKPVQEGGLLALLSTWDPSDEELPDIDERLQPARDVEL